MISRNCPVIMDVTNTASSYNTIEKNTTSEPMGISVKDSMDGPTENELLAEPNHDPEDEDTLSDDSLRLRLSDDEADDIEASSTDEPTTPFVSSETTTSRDTTIGQNDSDKIVQLANETQSAMHNSCGPESDKKLQGSPQPNEIPSETDLDAKQNIDSLWQGKNRKKLSANSTINRTIELSFSDPVPNIDNVRYNQKHSKIHKSPPYFNNQDNYGKPPGYRKQQATNWRYPKQKHLHDSLKKVLNDSVKEQGSNPVPDSCSKSDIKAEGPTLNQSPVFLTNLNSQNNSVNNDSDTDPPAADKYQLVNHKAETKMDANINKNQESLPRINDELAKECSHLNLDSESSSASKSLANPNSNYSNSIDREKLVSPAYDSKFASDDWFDEPHNTRNEFVQSIETSSLNQYSSNCEDIAPMSPVHDTECAIVAEPENNISIDDKKLPEDTTADLQESCLSAEETAGPNIGDTSNDANADIDMIEDGTPHDVQTEVKTDRPADKTAEELMKVGDSQESPKDHQAEVTSNKLIDVTDYPEKVETKDHTVNLRTNNKDEVVKVVNLTDASVEKQEPDSEDIEKSKEETKGVQSEISSLDEPKDTEQPMEIDTAIQVTGKDENNQSQESCTAGVESGISPNLNNPLATVAESVLEQTMDLKNIEDKEENTLVCSEPSKTEDNSTSISTENSKVIEESSSSKSNDNIETKSLPILKRCLAQSDLVDDKLTHKKIKITSDISYPIRVKSLGSENKSRSLGGENRVAAIDDSQESPKSLRYVRKFFQRDMKGKLSKLKREELEELIIQKLVETLTMRSEIGRLREQARTSERNQEAIKGRCQQLSKQIKDFDMVLSRNTADRRSNNNKPVPPIKINRSVGLQVNFVTDQGIQSLRGLTTNNAVKPNVPSPIIANGGHRKSVPEKIPHPATAPRRGLKIRSPRRLEIPKSLPLPVQPQAVTATPAALVISKPAETLHTLSITNNSKEQNLQNAQSTSAKGQNIVNGKIPHQINRHIPVPNNQKPESNDLIDLTEEEDKNKTNSSNASPSILPKVGTVTPSITTKVSQSRFQRIAQATPVGNVASPTQSANIRVVQSVAQPTPTALVNNINNTSLTYLMQRATGPGRQLLIAPNPNQIRPVTSTPRGQASNVTYKSGFSTLANGSVRVITTAAPTTANLQPPPAPLPDTPHYPTKNGWKQPPPPPSLKISKVPQGIVLSWNMAQLDTYAEIASYQLYAYQEIPGTPPNSNLWKKVGDVRALPLPMACTLKEFTPGNNYHFAVRAVDTHSRLGQYSVPRNISL